MSMYTRGISCTFPKLTYVSFLQKIPYTLIPYTLYLYTILYLKNKTK